MTLRLNSSRLLELGFTRSDVATLTTLLARSGIADGSVTPADNQKQFEEYPVTNLEAIEAQRGVEELRHELATTRGEMQALRAKYDELELRVAAIPQHDQLRNRIETIEARLA